MPSSKWLEELLFADNNNRSCKTAHFVLFSVNNLTRRNPSFNISFTFYIF
jgi:hypothetical protein